MYHKFLQLLHDNNFQEFICLLAEQESFNLEEGNILFKEISMLTHFYMVSLKNAA